MAKSVSKKAPKKASGKKKGRPSKKFKAQQWVDALNARDGNEFFVEKKRGRPRKNLAQPVSALERAAAVLVADTGLEYDEALKRVTAEYIARKAAAVEPAKSAVAEPTGSAVKEKNAFERNFGEGTAFDLDYGKLLIIALCIYIAVQVS